MLIRIPKEGNLDGALSAPAPLELIQPKKEDLWLISPNRGFSPQDNPVAVGTLGIMTRDEVDGVART